MPDSAYRFGNRSSGDVHGVVLTKPHVVDLILDLAGYTMDHDLGSLRLLEPACGNGAFLLPAVARLLESSKRTGVAPESLKTAIRAYDVDAEHVAKSRRSVTELLEQSGVSIGVSTDLAIAWVQHGDFLLAGDGTRFDAVVGNPPYIRIEQIPAVLQIEYRRRFNSLFDRADLYVAFIEHALHQLSDTGILSFICADRWTLNRYGAPLRRMISESFHVRNYIDLHQASPFESEVIAYPAIFTIGRVNTKRVKVISLSNGSPEECQLAANIVRGDSTSARGVVASDYPTWFQGEEPWVLSGSKHFSFLKDLERRFDPMEAQGTRVGIGVATGNDKVYIVGADADIERDRLVPLVMREDIAAGRITDANRFVINTFQNGGGLIDLDEYPRLKRYLDRHSHTIRARHIARSSERSWFRTIDRVYPDLVERPKLLIPDIAGANEVVLDEGRFHPHHNLYFVTSESWDMRILGALLSSRVALFFVWSYAVKMRGRYLRFQAQYLRRIRLPNPVKIGSPLGRKLASAFDSRDFKRIDELAMEAYKLTKFPDFTFVDTRS